MTGGTSLSVWMGGATMELQAMLVEGSEAVDGRVAADRAGHVRSSLYAELCDLTNTTPVVDVITGSSAGALNGALLAAAVAYRTDAEAFREVRRLWMESADIQSMLETTDRRSRPWSPRVRRTSLLSSERFRHELAATIGRWRDASVREQGSRLNEVDLVVTYTGLEPRTLSRLDDFGEAVTEDSYGGVLRFQTEDFDPAGAGVTIPDRLAAAATASAAMPGIFEPVNLHPLLWDNADEPPCTSRWVVDGGVSVNLPLTEALVRIYNSTTTGLSRRVALYLSPTAGTGAAKSSTMTSAAAIRHRACVVPKAETASAASFSAANARPNTGPPVKPGFEDPHSLPPLGQPLRTLVKAAMAQGVSDDLADLQRHNRAVSQQQTTRSAISWLLRTDDGHHRFDDQPEIMALYCVRRAENSADGLLDRLDPLTQRWTIDFRRLRDYLVTLRATALPQIFPDDPLAQDDWPWGISPVEESCATLMSLLTRTLRLPLPPEAMKDATPHASALLEIQDRIGLLQRQCRLIRDHDEDYWLSIMRVRRAILVSGSDDELRDVLQDAYRLWPQMSRHQSRHRMTVTQAEVRADLRRLFEKVADEARQLRAPIMAILGLVPETTVSPTRWQVIGRVAAALQREIAFLPLSEDTAVMARALFRLHAIHTVTVGRPYGREQGVELLQISWNAPDRLTGRSGTEKLTGNEFARLGAFIKPTWRANDFFWGRMDAAAGLVQLLADPLRLAQLGRTSATVIEQLGLGGLESDTLQRLTAELAYLDDDQTEIPRMLPQLVEILTMRRQSEIARIELPRIAHTLGAVDAGHTVAGNTSHQARVFAEELAVNDLSTHLAVEQALCAMRIGEETATTESRSDLLQDVLRRVCDQAIRTSSGRWITRTLLRRPLSNLLRRFIIRIVATDASPPSAYRCTVEKSALDEP